MAEGETLARAGEPLGRYIVVESGEVDVHAGQAGGRAAREATARTDAVSRTLVAGDSLGALTTAPGAAPSAVTATMTRAGSVWALDTATFRQLLATAASSRRNADSFDDVVGAIPFLAALSEGTCRSVPVPSDACRCLPMPSGAF